MPAAIRRQSGPIRGHRFYTGQGDNGFEISQRIQLCVDPAIAATTDPDVVGRCRPGCNYLTG